MLTQQIVSDLLDVVELIVKLAALVSALYIIFSPMIKLTKRWHQMEEMMESTNKYLRMTRRDLLKVIVCSPYFCIEEQIEAGEEYIELGGNGMIKKIVLQKIDEKVQRDNRRATD